jgi:putative Holliday junction resolvase
MPKALAIDYGSKRTGLAITDEQQIFAFGLQTVATQELMTFLKTMVIKEKIGQFVLGEPKRLNNEASSTTEMVYQFKRHLEKTFPEIPVALIDERLTSRQAQQTVIQSGLKKKDRQDKSLLDTISATLILQAYLERNS